MKKEGDEAEGEEENTTKDHTLMQLSSNVLS
jgi:hypothetical protein